MQMSKIEKLIKTTFKEIKSTETKSSAESPTSEPQTREFIEESMAYELMQWADDGGQHNP